MDPEGRAPPAVNDQRHRPGASARFASSGGANGAALGRYVLAHSASTPPA
jgi:hypothetical protein